MNRNCAITIILAVAIVGCANSAAQDNKRISIVGLWEENDDTVHAITLRKQNGTYRRKIIQRYDYAKVPITYEENGRWKMDGTRYVFISENISAPLWSKDVGKRRSLQVLQRTATVFRYLSTDGAVVEERKIGDASDSMFDKIQLKGLRGKK